jgi:glycine/D-amino acid oxidase-like deaminating enzyme
MLLEAGKVAHGATGHNAGQIVSYFERPFASLVEEFGIDMACRAQASIDSAWDILNKIQQDAKLKTPFWRFVGYAGCIDLDQILTHLKDSFLKTKGGLLTERIYISVEHIRVSDIPREYEGLYHMVPQEYILSLLDTDNPAYVGVLCYDKGCMNSAAFSEEIAGYLLAQYPERFSLVEETLVNRVVLKKENAVLETALHHVQVDRVILCTNGFEHITIINENGLDINTLFHHRVEGKIGYMAAFLESKPQSPAAISYFAEPGSDPEAAYFYLTRRPYQLDDETEQTLLSVGGPEKNLNEQNKYISHAPFDESEFQKIKNFVQKNVHGYTPDTERELFLWHGLMGYTPNLVRLIGTEPRNPVLMYNLGCNGIGILPSLYGAQRIADIVSQKDIEVSIFDPKE